jgi:hypothetical protein
LFKAIDERNELLKPTKRHFLQASEGAISQQRNSLPANVFILIKGSNKRDHTSLHYIKRSLSHELHLTRTNCRNTKVLRQPK